MLFCYTPVSTMTTITTMVSPAMNEDYWGYKGRNTMEILQCRVARKSGFLNETYLGLLPDELLDLIFKEVYREGMVMDGELPITIVFRETGKSNQSKKMIYASANDPNRGGREFIEIVRSNTLCIKHIKKEFGLQKAPHTMLVFEMCGKKPYLNTDVRHPEQYFKFWSAHGGDWKTAAFFLGTVWLQVDRKKN